MWLLRTLPNNVLGHIGIKHGLKGANACITNHSVGGTLAVIEALEALRDGEADRAVAVGHETPIEPQMVLYYHRLGLLASEMLRPFDARHDGSLFGEGAGALVLETEASAAARKAPVLGEVLGGGYACEAQGLARDPRRRRRARARDRAGARRCEARACRRRHDRRARQRHAAIRRLGGGSAPARLRAGDVARRAGAAHRRRPASACCALSGVVTPFLSLGRFLVDGVDLAVVVAAAGRVAAGAADRPEDLPFLHPGYRDSGWSSRCCSPSRAGRAFMVQISSRGDDHTRQTRTRQADGAVRPQEDPRLREVARLGARDPRSPWGPPIAMDSTLDVSAHAEGVRRAIRVTPAGRRPGPGANDGAGSTARPAAPAATAARASCPSGAIRSAAAPSPARPRGVQRQLGAPNSAFVEREFNTRLRGRTGTTATAGLWITAYEPFDRSVRAILDRPRATSR